MKTIDIEKKSISILGNVWERITYNEATSEYRPNKEYYCAWLAVSGKGEVINFSTGRSNIQTMVKSKQRDIRQAEWLAETEYFYWSGISSVGMGGLREFRNDLFKYFNPRHHYLNTRKPKSRVNSKQGIRFPLLVSGLYLYQYFDVANNLIYVGITKNFQSRQYGHRITHWYPSAHRVLVKPFRSEDLARETEYKLIRSMMPHGNVAHNPSAA